MFASPTFLSRSILLLLLFLSACSPLTTAPSQQVTASVAVQITPSPAPTLQPLGTPTVTVLPHLQVEPAQLKGVTIRFWHPLSGSAAESLAAAIKEFNRKNEWGIKVESSNWGSTGGLDEGIQSLQSDADLPNVVLASSEQLRDWQSANNWMINLQDYLEDTRWGLAESDVRDFNPAFWEQDVLAGRRLGLPAVRTAHMLFYNLTWAQELGFIMPPTTPEELQKQACAAAAVVNQDEDKANNGTGGWIVSTDPMAVLSWLEAFGAGPYDGGAAAGFEFNTPETRAAFSYLRTMVDDGCAWVSRLPTPYDYFANRQALFYSGSIEELPVQQLANARAESPDRWTVIPYPGQDGEPVLVSSGLSYGIVAASKEQQLASWLLIRWLSTQEVDADFVAASSTWPVRLSVNDLLADYRQKNELWGQTLLWIPKAVSAPEQPAWRKARLVLQDSAWQLFQTNTKPEQIPEILSILDATTAEITNRR